MHTAPRRITQLFFIILAAWLFLPPTQAHGQTIDQDVKYIAPDGSINDRFGSSIAINENGLVVIGIPGDQVNGIASGSATLYDSSTGNSIMRLLPDDTGTFVRFGGSVAIENDIVAVGTMDNTASGSVYIFDASTGVQLFKLLPNDGTFGKGFGEQLAISNGIVAVGAPKDNVSGPSSGSAYLFNASTGQQIAKLLPDVGAAVDFFGSAISIENGIVAVGAPRSNQNNTQDSGGVFLYDASTGLLNNVLRPDFEFFGGQRFGTAVSMSNGKIAVTAINDNDNTTSSGSVYLFDASTGTRITKFFPTGTVSGDAFGFSVAMNNNTIAVGSQSDDNQSGIDSGSVYLFDATTGVQTNILIPDFSDARPSFGASVAINGGIIGVGAPEDDENGTSSGTAYLFESADGIQTQKLLTADLLIDNRFGSAIAIDSSNIAIGSSGDEDNGFNSGSAYILSSFDGHQFTKLLPDDGASGDRFGNAIDISNSIAAVGARGSDDNGFSSGSAYLFDATLGNQLAKLLPDDSAEFQFFGWSIAIDQNTVAVGAIGDSENGPFSGAVYLFDSASGLQTAKLTPDDGAFNHSFGQSVALDNGIVAIGAWGDNPNGSGSGSAYLFDAATGIQIAKLIPEDGAAGDQFGNSIAIFNNIVAVGAWLDTDNGTASGSVYIFDVSTGEQIAKLLPDNAADGDQFGASVAISETNIIVGADRADQNGSGSGYLYDAQTLDQVTELIPSDGASGDQFASSVAIQDQFVIAGAPLNSNYGGPISGAVYGFDTRILSNPDCPADMNSDGDLNFFDVSLYIFAFRNQIAAADFTGDGSFNAFDISAFLSAFAAGCP